MITAPIGDLASFVSVDNGQSWTRGNPVNDQGDASREGLHNLSAIPGAGFYVTWLDLRNKTTEVWGAFSANGKDWGKNRSIYKSPDGSVCECCHPSVAASKNGKLVVMWRNSLNGSRDMYWAKSEDHGESFSNAEKLGSDTWKIEACPMDGGSIGLSDDKPFTVWQRSGQIYRASTGESEELIGKGTQPVAIDVNGKHFISWTSNRRIKVMATGQEPIDLGKGNYVSLAYDSKASRVFAVWEGGDAPAGVQFAQVDAK